MPNYDQMAILQALQGASGNQMQQQQPNNSMGNIQQMLMNYGQQSQQQPSWLDALGHTMMMGGMMNQGGYGMGNMGYGMGGMGMGGMPGYGSSMGQQMPANWWQKGLQGTGSFLSGAAPYATAAGLGGTASPLAPFALPLAAGGIAAGGLGSLLSHLGQPGMQQ